MSINKLLNNRPPIVSIIGHVDHGKTSILNCIRKINKFEYRGITQYIETYKIKINNNIIIFLDTPGHEAFINLVNSSIKLIDIIIVVISIDDDLKNNIINIIKKIKELNIPIIIVLNKIDKKNNNLFKIKNNLIKYNIIPTDMGGNYKFIYTSAKLNTGINDLLNEIIFQSNKINLSYSPLNNVKCIVIDSYIDNKRGLAVYLLIKDGVLKINDFIFSKSSYGKIKFMFDENNNNIYTAYPETPVKVFGLIKSPIIGDEFNLIKNSKEIKKIILENKKYKNNYYKNINNINIKSNNIFDLKNKNLFLNYIIKSDTQNTNSIIINTINDISFKKNISINIINYNIGLFNEYDLYLAMNSKSSLLGFNIKLNNKIINLINKFKITFKCYFTIYDLIKDIEEKINNLFLNIKENNILGIAEVINIFNISTNNYILGCKMKSGIINKDNNIKVIRNNNIIYEGKIYSMKILKKNVYEVSNKMEFGISIKNKINIKKGDIINSFINNKYEQ